MPRVCCLGIAARHFGRLSSVAAVHAKVRPWIDLPSIKPVKLPIGRIMIPESLNPPFLAIESLSQRIAMLFSAIKSLIALASLGAATILQNGQVRITNYPDTSISLSEGSYETFNASIEEIHYMGRWDTKHVSYWA